MMSEEEKDKMRAMDNAITGLIRSMDNNEQIIDHNHKFICEKLIEFSENNSRVLKLVHDTIRNLGILAANPGEAREAIARTVREESVVVKDQLLRSISIDNIKEKNESTT